MEKLWHCVQVYICLSRFKNVDLYKEGLYRVSITVSNEQDDGTSKALYSEKDLKDFSRIHRFRTQTTPSLSEADSKKIRDSPAAFKCGEVDEVTFFSQTFHVRYVNEEFAFQDEVVFELKVDALNTSCSLYLNIGLEFADISKPTPQARNVGPVGTLQHEFQEVKRVELMLKNVNEGFHEYAPIMFNDPVSSGFALLDLCIVAGTVSLFMDFTNNWLPSAGLYILNLFRVNYPNLVDYTNGIDLEDEFSELDIPELIAFAENIRKLLLGPALQTQATVQDFWKGFPAEMDKTTSLYKYDKQKEPELTSELYDRRSNTFMPLSFRNCKGNLKNFCLCMLKETQMVFSIVMEKWFAHTERISERYGDIVSHLKSTWKQKAIDRAGEYIVRYRCSVEEILVQGDTNLPTSHATTAKRLRQVNRSIEEVKPYLIDKSIDIEYSRHPVIFEQFYTKESSLFPPYEERSIFQCKGIHVIVLVHGFMGSPWDLRGFRNYLSILVPNARFLLSKVNENGTDCDINMLADNLAREIDEFCESLCLTNAIEKLSIISHSLGSIIARAALVRQRLKIYRTKLHTFFSLASPHLGTAGNRSSLINTGMWVICKWRKALSLEQLAMNDSDNLRECFLYKLSQVDVLKEFHNIVLVCGHQDLFVPYHSARIEAPSKLISKRRKFAQIQHEMVNNILSKCDPSAVTRIDISYHLDSSSSESRLDDIIGRTAHVKMLDSPTLMLKLLLNYHERFFF